MSPFAKQYPSVKTIDPYKVWNTGPIFSHVSTSLGASRIIATSGETGRAETGDIPSDPDAQIELAFQNLGRSLEAAGATIKDIFKLVWYVVNYDVDNRTYRKHLVKFLDGHRPSTTMVPVAKLAEPGYIFEIEAYAAVRQFPLQEVDVIVVGAGLSGLKAAYDVQKAGFSCLVVEARDRVGGKTWSVDPLGEDKYVDLGAAWINDTNQAKIWELARSLGLGTAVQNTNGNVVHEDLGGDVSLFEYGSNPVKLAESGGLENMLYVRDLAEKACQTIDIHNPVGSGADLDKYTLEEWVKLQGGGKTALASVRVWTRAMLGVEPSDMSALYFMDYCKSGGGLMQMRSDKKNGGQYIRLAQGAQSISIGLANLLNTGSIILNSPVRMIQQDQDRILVSAGRGELSCQRVIVSVPTPLYKEITFLPPLPRAKEELSKVNILVYQLKVMLLYAEPWWRASKLCGLLQSFEGPVAVTRDSSVESKKQYSLTCFVPGKSGLSLSIGTQKARFGAVLAQIRCCFGPFVRGKVPEPLAIAEHEWAKDQWAQGCPCPVSPPGLMTDYGHALRTSHGKVHFVGTETAFEWKGYMDGAVRSGQRGAEEVIRMIRGPKI